jgi:Na+/H+ antiporter NhaA
MTFFFFVVGLEARREFDLGELRERRRFALPLLAALGGMAVPVAIYLAFNAGDPAAHGWAVAMSTDTAFALGLLALVGPRFPARLRAFMLTVAVVDDLVALVVIATVYTEDLAIRALLVALGLFAILLVVRGLRVRKGLVCGALGVATWVAMLKSGVDPIVVGLAMGLVTYAYPSSRSDLEEATERFRAFREQPTPELARVALQGVRSTISPNERLQQLFHPWTSYAIVPIFALANAGVVVDGDALGRAFRSPVMLGIVVGYVVGKPLGLFGVTWLASRLSGGRLRPPVGWAAVAGGGTIAGIGFTVALLVASIAFEGTTLEDAKIGILTAALVATAVTWLLFRATAKLPPRLRIRALAGGAEPLTDLYLEVDPDRDHTRGPVDAPVTIVEYGDFECPYCGMAEGVIRELLAGFGDLRYVWRHLPLNDVHASAQLAAEALHQHTMAARIAEDVDSADLSGVSGTPTFFVNGRRHYGAYDIDTLTTAVRAARARASLA